MNRKRKRRAKIQWKSLQNNSLRRRGEAENRNKGTDCAVVTGEELEGRAQQASETSTI